MLSPGQWYKHVPKDPEANLKYRLDLYRSLHGNPSAQRGLRAMCGQDLLFYVNAFVWQYNPNEKGHEVGPFVTWGYQDEAFLEILECIEEDEDFIIEKSREMGASWMCLIVMEWLWHWHPWKKFLSISRSADLVDSDDPDSLFWKIDFMHRYEPGWLMPKGYEVKKHRRLMYYGNPENGSTITGQASTGKAGVGGRATWMFVDEFSQIREDYEVLHRTSDTTGCRGFNFTHTDINNAAAELSRRVDIRKIQMHWTQHPRKKPGLYEVKDGKVNILDKQYQFPVNFNFVMDGSPTGGPKPGIRSPWYDEQCRRKGSGRAIAMDLDINPSGSMAQVYDALVIHKLRRHAVPAYWEGDIVVDKEKGRVIQLVRRPGGPLRLWCHLNYQQKPTPALYGAGADIATGSGATNSCVDIINAKIGMKVAEYADPYIEPQDLAPIAVALCWLFKSVDNQGARLCWEQQGPGLTFGKHVMRLGYVGSDQIFYRTAELPHNRKIVETDIPGWYPSPENKRLAIEAHRDALKHGELTDLSDEALEETLAFRYNAQGNIEHSGEVGTNDPTGARVNHGDRVIATALAWKMCQAYGITPRAIEEEEVAYNPCSLAWRRQMVENQREEVWA